MQRCRLFFNLLNISKTEIQCLVGVKKFSGACCFFMQGFKMPVGSAKSLQTHFVPSVFTAKPEETAFVLRRWSSVLTHVVLLHCSTLLFYFMAHTILSSPYLSYRISATQGLKVKSSPLIWHFLCKVAPVSSVTLNLNLFGNTWDYSLQISV